MNLRNHESVYPLCGRPQALTKEEFLQTLTPRTHLFIIMAGQYRAGYIRFDPVNDSYGIGVALLPEHRGCGIGSLAIKFGMKEMSFITKTFLAMVRVDNEASKRLFEKCGFELITTEGDFTYYGLR